MTKNNVALINLIVGILIVTITICFDIKDNLGFGLTILGVLLVFSGIILNRKITEVFFELIRNLF